MLQEKYLFEDQPLEEMIVPIDGITLAVESGGELIFGRLELPAVQSKEERTPLLLMMHGHPGISRNTDLAIALRRAGIATCYFSYRGLWGSHGDYTFSHIIEDTQTMFAYLKAHADEWRLDPERFYVLGCNALSKSPSPLINTATSYLSTILNISSTISTSRFAFWVVHPFTVS